MFVSQGNHPAKLSCVVMLTFSFIKSITTGHRCEKQEYRTWFSHSQARSLSSSLDLLEGEQYNRFPNEYLLGIQFVIM